MTGRSKIRVDVDIPNELLRDFLQRIRDFDTVHRGALGRFDIGVECPDLRAAEIEAILDSIVPKFPSVTRAKADGS